VEGKAGGGGVGRWPSLAASSAHAARPFTCRYQSAADTRNREKSEEKAGEMWQVKEREMKTGVVNGSCVKEIKVKE
jgi:hypothetical protein